MLLQKTAGWSSRAWWYLQLLPLLLSDFLEDDGRAPEVSTNRCGVFSSYSSCLTTRDLPEANFRKERLQSSRVVLCFGCLFLLSRIKMGATRWLSG